MRWRPWFQRLFLLGTSVVVAIGSIEIAIRFGDLFAAQRQLAAAGAESAAADGQHQDLPGAILHPYLGYTQRPGTSTGPPPAETLALFFDGDVEARARYEALPESRRTTTINAQGYASGIADYRAVAPERFTIGIFGGSVADAFAAVVALGLKPELAAAIGVPPGSIEILDFAKGSYRQPQQLIALIEASLAGIPLDLVINLDGFNEMAMASNDCVAGHDPLYPSGLQYVPLAASLMQGASRQTLEAILRIQQLRERQAALRARLAMTPWSSSETAKAVGGVLLQRWTSQRLEVERQLQASAVASSQGDLPLFLPTVQRDADGCRQAAAELWQRSSRLMRLVAREMGAEYLHVLQPNQYVADAKPLSAAEIARAWKPDLGAAVAARAGYPLLVVRAGELRRQGLDVVDLTQVFAAMPETTYIDLCCHLNYRGNRLLLEAIAPAIADLQRRRSGS